MSKNAPGIGLDIGSKKIKLAKIHKGGKGFKLESMGSINTPFGTVETGAIYNPEQVGEELGALVRTMGLRGKWVVSAVSGQQVYNRNLIMPKMKMNELRDAAIFQATTFLPIPVEEAAIDIFPVKSYFDEEGEKTEVFFVAVRQQQVDNIITVCNIAGLKLAALEIEPVAINRYFWDKKDTGVHAYLNIGSFRSYLSVFKDNTLGFHRYMPFGSSAFLQNTNGADATPDNDATVAMDVPVQGSDYLMADMISEMQRSVEYYAMQNPNNPLGKIMLCGGGSRLKGIEDKLESSLDIQFNLADPLERLSVPGNIDAVSEDELRYDFLVALGLSARGLI